MPPDSRPNAFHTTRWTQVRQAKADSDDGRRALANLCDVCYEPLKPWFMSDAAHGDQAALAAAAGFGVSALKMAVQRLRLRFRECLQAEIAATLEDAAMVQEEMSTLMAALAA